MCGTKGWNKKYDEWVEAPGLTKFDAALLGVSLDTVGAANGSGPGSRAGARSGPGAAEGPLRGAFNGGAPLAAADALEDRPLGGVGGASASADAGASGCVSGAGASAGPRGGERKKRRVDELGGGAAAPLPGPPVRALRPLSRPLPRAALCRPASWSVAASQPVQLLN